MVTKAKERKGLFTSWMILYWIWFLFFFLYIVLDTHLVCRSRLCMISLIFLFLSGWCYGDCRPSLCVEFCFNKKRTSTKILKDNQRWMNEINSNDYWLLLSWIHKTVVEMRNYFGACCCCSCSALLLSISTVEYVCVLWLLLLSSFSASSGLLLLFLFLF